MVWLYGPAGAGKSAIAQTIAEKAQEENMLAASFFFSRGDPKRNSPKYLFLSLAYQLAYAIPELRDSRSSVHKADPRACRSLSRPRRRPGSLIVDGLDECAGTLAQQRILYIMASALLEDMPFRILICSRPEPSIRDAFNTDSFGPYLLRIALDHIFGPGHDIEIFLENEFERICNNPHSNYVRFPCSWPAPGVISELVRKASGQFIYATTVIKFVDEEYFDPCQQLDLILHPNTHSYPELSSPFHDLDALYHQILSSNPRRSKVRDVIRALLSIILVGGQNMFSQMPQHIEALLLLPEGKALSALRGMHSIFKIRDPEDEVRTLHASFIDFLWDESRSGYFFVGSDKDLHGFLANLYFRVIDHHIQGSDNDEAVLTQARYAVFDHAWAKWGNHITESNFNDNVLGTVHAVIVQNPALTGKLGSHITDYLYADRMVSS
ncbi:nwd2 [Moniliophthora roreri MCA 2997]|nr:nwd2 [Moniliophthora roreri MCA 2997]KAI3605738.1 nwd2 [Moniliophthora roreri]